MTAAGVGVRRVPMRAGRVPSVLPGRLIPVPSRTAESGSSPRRVAVWYAVFAVYAGIVAVVSAASYERSWGIWAVGGYAAASLAAACWRSHGRDAALLASVSAALVAPVTWLATQAPPTPDVQVVSRAAALLLRHGTPYLAPALLAHLPGHLAYNPYLPAMAVFGMPDAVGAPGLAGDPRPWLVAVTLTLFVLAFRLAGRRDAFRLSLFAVASPVVAFPLAVGITDPPVLAMVCLALALLGRTAQKGLAWPAAIVIGVACAMKYTAWPALPVLAAMLAARDGARAAFRFSAAAIATTAALIAAFAPAALSKPAALIQNTVLYPLALTRAQTPAASPLPGHLLAMTGQAGHLAAVGLLVAAGLAVAVSLVVRPPADGPAAARRLALGLIVMFALSPAPRFGYFAYPVGLYGWLVLSEGTAQARRDPMPGSAPPAGPPAGHTATLPSVMRSVLRPEMWRALRSRASWRSGGVLRLPAGRLGRRRAAGDGRPASAPWTRRRGSA